MHWFDSGRGHPYAGSLRSTRRWLTIHAPDGGFAAFMRAIRDGHAVMWDIADVPPDGGLPANEVIVNP